MEQCKTINRLRVVLAETNKTNRWLAETIGKNEQLSHGGAQIDLNHQ